jgi:transposase InsO family protein
LVRAPALQAGGPRFEPATAHHATGLIISGTFHYLCNILDGYSRYIVHWDLPESMTEVDIEIVLQRAKQQHPGARPRIILDNGPQFIAKDFREFIRISGMTHVRTSPYYPQSNGENERWHKSLKEGCLRPGTPQVNYFPMADDTFIMRSLQLLTWGVYNRRVDGYPGPTR